MQGNKYWLYKTQPVYERLILAGLIITDTLHWRHSGIMHQIKQNLKKSFFLIFLFVALQYKVLYLKIMEKESQPLEDIKIIKKMMEESSRFLSLSGLSGVSAGILAIAGAIAAKLIIPDSIITGEGYSESFGASSEGITIIKLLFTDAALVLVLALASAFFFSWRKAKRDGKSIWTPVTKRMFLNLAIPLAAGGLFVIITMGHVPGHVSASATLIFYGLALINGGKFTFSEIYWLGVIEVLTGLICLLIPGYTLLLWAFGFGVLHIIYGLFMYIRYKG
jgi:hypothetical protein